jgi:thymidylate synthase
VGSFAAESIDDLMHDALSALLDGGQATNPTRGPARELRGVRLELTNPRVRLSRSLARGKPFSCLGELVWYLAGSGDAEHIEFYVRKYRDEAEPDGTVHAAYGTRLFADSGRLATAIATLRSKRDSRQAVVPLLDADDLLRRSGHVPCTSTLQFFLRDGLLDLVVSMRSNDAYLGLPHDVFAFTMLQEIVARSVDAELGTYVHMAGSLHLYDEHVESARSFLDEGFTVPKAMPPMPSGDPWPEVARLVEAERAIRLDGPIDFSAFGSPYWADLARLLKLFALTKKDASDGEIARIRSEMHSHDVYDVFLNDRFGVSGDRT